MRTECCECDHMAYRFYGGFAYCRHCYEKAVLGSPEAHKCPKCGKTQPPQVLWRKDAPCKECQNDQRRRN
jgi:hypothetical protein